MRVSIGRVLAVAVALVAPVLVAMPGSPATAAATTSVDCNDMRQSVPPPSRSMESYTAITPKRIVDTREGLGGYDGIVEARCTLRLDLSDSVVPDDADAVALSVTAVSDFRGFITVFQCSSGRPMPSNLNTRGDSPTPNLVVAVPEADGSVCLYAHVDMHMVIDVQGWWSDGPNRFVPVDPVRAYDSRELPGDQRLGAFQIRNVTVADEFVPDDATSVVINLTVDKTTGPGWMVAFPCGETPPVASNINYIGNDTRAVAAIVGIGTRNGGEGQICFQTMRTTHFIVDVVGYHAPAPAFGPSVEMRTAQQRLVDTRDDTGPWDRQFREREVRMIDPLVGIPNAADVSAVVINAIGLNATKQGFLTFYPCTSTAGTPPTVSTLNTLPNREVANLLTVQLGTTGKLCVLSHTAGDVVLDLVGVMALPQGSPLQQLAIDGAAVYPKFDPDGRDYALKCGAGTNQIGITAVPHRGRTVRVEGRSVESGVRFTVPVTTDEVFAVDVRTAGGALDRYHFRCLPADFRHPEIAQPGTPTPGWYATGTGGAGTFGAFAVLFDERGAPVWYQRTDGYPINVQRLTDGTIAFGTSNDSGYAAGPEESGTVIDLDGNVVAEIKSDDVNRFPIDYHELLQRPGGGWTQIAYELLDDEYLTPLADAGFSGPGDCEYGPSEYAVNGSIREVSAGPPFTSDWDWSAIDHFDIAEVQFPVRFNIYRPMDACGEVDLFHLNSVAAVPDPGGAPNDYVVSARHLDAVFRIDRDSPTGAIDWILSSTPASIPNKDGVTRLTILNDPLGGPRRSHDARLNGDVLTLFDNRTGTGQPARAVAYRINEAANTATLLWQINEPQGRSSGALGALRVGADGSRLVTWGALQPTMNEFDVNGNLLLSIGNINSYRVVKYPVGWFNRDELRAKAGSGGAAGLARSTLERQESPGGIGEMSAPTL